MIHRIATIKAIKAKGFGKWWLAISHVPNTLSLIKYPITAITIPIKAIIKIVVDIPFSVPKRVLA